MAAAPVAYKFSIAVATGYIPRYNKIHWQQSCPVKEAAGGCPSAPCSASMQAPPQPADADGTALAPAKARRKARTCQVAQKHASKQVEGLELAWIYIYHIYIYIIFVWKRVLTSLQTSLHQHSRKRLFILTSSISNCCCVLHRARQMQLTARPLPSTGYRCIAVLLQHQKEYSNAWRTTPSQACCQSEIIWLARATAEHLAAHARAAAGLQIYNLCIFKFQTSTSESKFVSQLWLHVSWNSKWLESTCQ